MCSKRAALSANVVHKSRARHRRHCRAVAIVLRLPPPAGFRCCSSTPSHLPMDTGAAQQQQQQFPSTTKESQKKITLRPTHTHSSIPTSLTPSACACRRAPRSRQIRTNKHALLRPHCRCPASRHQRSSTISHAKTDARCHYHNNKSYLLFSQPRTAARINDTRLRAVGLFACRARARVRRSSARPALFNGCRCVAQRASVRRDWRRFCV